MSKYQNKFRDMFEMFSQEEGLVSAVLSAIDEDGATHILAEWKRGQSPPEVMPKEYEEGFERAVLDSPIVHQSMQLPLSTENRLKAAVHCLYQYVLQLERKKKEQLKLKI